MASLAGTQIRNTYPGLLKTTENDAITSSLKQITDGSGNSTALKLSDSKARLEALEINTVANTQSVLKFLTYNTTTGAVGYYDYSASSVPVSVATATTDPDGFDGAEITIGTDQTFNIAQGSNIQVTASGSTVTIASAVSDSAQYVDFAATRPTGEASGGFGDVELTFTDYEQNDTVSRLVEGDGIKIRRTDNSDNGIDIKIQQDYAFKEVSGLTPTVNLSNFDFDEIDILMNVSDMHTNSTYSTLTIPPPRAGRVIKIFLDECPTSYNRTVRVQIATDDNGTNYFYGKVLVTHANPTTGYKIQHSGKSTNATSLLFSDADGYAGYIGDTIYLTGTGDNYYHVNAFLSKEFDNSNFTNGIGVISNV